MLLTSRIKLSGLREQTVEMLNSTPKAALEQRTSLSPRNSGFLNKDAAINQNL
jgi:hypothetical protein